MRDLLIKLGYTNNEAQTILLLIDLGPSLASTLARLSKIKRPTIYVTLEKLRAKGLIHSFKKGSATYYAVDDVKKIYLEEKERCNIALDFLEEVRKRDNKRSLTTEFEISYYKGKEGFKSIHQEILSYNPESIMGWINFETFYKCIDIKEDIAWTKQRVKKGIETKLIAVSSELALKFREKDEKLLRKIKISKNLQFSTSCILYENQICIFNPGKDFSGIKINNSEVAKMFKEIFEAQWGKISEK